MVVKNLEKFMEENNFTLRGNLKNIVLENKPNASNQTPTIIIDFSSLPEIYPPNDMSLFCYGRPKVVKEKIEKLITSITSLGVDVVAVFRGNPKKPIKIWIGKRNSDYERAKTFFENLKNGILDRDCICTHDIAYLRDCIKNTVKSISSPRLKVFTSLKSSHEAVAGYARKYNCLAVLGQDSNYVIYNEVPRYISMRGFDVDTLDCIMYDREKFLRNMKLSVNQLPLFATMCGNDITNGPYLKSIHSSLSDPKKHLFFKIAEIIQDVNDPYHFIGQKGFERFAKCFKESLDMYSNRDSLSMHLYHMALDRKLNFLDQKKESGDLSVALYGLIKEKQIRLSTFLNHVPDSGMVSTQKMFQHLRGKIYDVVLNQGNEVSITEYYTDIQTGNKLKYFSRTVYATPHSLPSMEQLWSENTNAMHEFKWNLFCKNVSSTLTPHYLKSIPPKLRLFIVTLHYLAHEMPKKTNCKLFNEIFEVRALLLTALRVFSKLKKEENASFDLPDDRAFLLCEKFFQCYFFMGMLNQACGLIVTNEDSCPCNFFDGVLFQYIYKKLKGGVTEEEFMENSITLDVIFETLFDIVCSEF